MVGVLVGVLGSALVAVLTALGGCAAPRPAAGPEGAEASAVARPVAATRAEPPAFPASDVLRRWDQQRAGAFANGDPRALERLYVAGAPVAAADVALLRAYLRRGLRVTGMRMQVLALAVLEESPRRLRLRVTDRLTGAAVVDASGRSSPLPRDQVSTHVVVLHRERRGRWLVAEVRS